ncbi:hypothetical protein MZO42_16060 [Sphingomonas psychrotolerans]|uniref:Lipoprotein n=1 Tax=Sphingomonas psychrotolerans TaxID=1327635 RepID=A0ABU3N9N0_9SPHN|nr:hypothetical protein [Sphingomonas psychrotolerans]MDT8760216.1 hypothetical protein [Sphingomonas psychrotolerans]
MKAPGLAGIVVCALGLGACAGGGSVKTAWQDVVKRCAASTLNGKKILFFGPSNGVGSGSVWRIDGEGVYRLRYDLKHMPKPQDFYADFTPTSCDGKSTKNFKGGFNASLGETPLTAEAKAQIDRARTVSAKANSVAWVPVAEGPYDSYIKANAASDVSKDLMTGSRYVLTRAFKVSGFETKITFDSKTAVSAKAALPAGSVIPSSLGGGLDVSWSETGELTLKSQGDFFIAGEFQQYKPDGFASGASTVLGEKVDIAPAAKAARD